jgi:hypothetical protein
VQLLQDENESAVADVLLGIRQWWNALCLPFQQRTGLGRVSAPCP